MMEPEFLIYFVLLALVSEILGTIGGFGSSLFFVPIAGYFLDFHSVLGITALFHITSNLSKIYFFRQGFDKKLILLLGIPAVVLVIIGAWISQFLPVSVLEIILSAFLIVLSLTFLIFKNMRLNPTTANAVGGGVLSGFMAGIIGTGGAIRGLVLVAFNLKTEVFIATSAIIDLAIDASRSFVYYANGYIHVHDLYLIPILLVVSVIGTFIGKKILFYISEVQFRSIVLVLVLITGVMTLIKFI